MSGPSLLLFFGQPKKRVGKIRLPVLTTHYEYIAGGTLIIGGQTSYQVVAQPATGTLVISGGTQYSLNLLYSAVGVMEIIGEFEAFGNIEQDIVREIAWTFGGCVPNWFRVEGTCQTPPQPTGSPGGQCGSGNCPQSFVANIAACDVEEVCRKLSAQGLMKTISSIKQYPVGYNKQNLNSVDPTCLTDVTPNPDTCQECCSFLLDYTPFTLVNGVMGVNIVFLYATHVDMLVAGAASYGFRTNSTYWQYDADGSVILSGIVQSGMSSWQYTAEGSMIVSGGNPVSYGNGMLQIIGNTTYGASFLGEIDFDGDSEDVQPLQYALFADTPAPAIDVSNLQTVSQICCTSEFPSTLFFTHNLQNIDALASFLQLNNLHLPGVIGRGLFTADAITLLYSDRSASWRGNLHYRGQSTQSLGQETWDLTFEFACTNMIDITQLSKSEWKFSLVVRGRQGNEQVNARLLLLFSAGVVCPDNQTWEGFIFNFDPTAAKTQAQQVIFHNDDLLVKTALQFEIYPQLLQDFSRTFNHPLDAQLTASKAVAAL